MNDEFQPQARRADREETSFLIFVDRHDLSKVNHVDTYS